MKKRLRKVDVPIHNILLGTGRKRTKRERELVRRDPYGNADKDKFGIINIADCRPYDSSRDISWSGIKSSVSSIASRFSSASRNVYSRAKSIVTRKPSVQSVGTSYVSSGGGGSSGLSNVPTSLGGTQPTQPPWVSSEDNGSSGGGGSGDLSKVPTSLGGTQQSPLPTTTKTPTPSPTEIKVLLKGGVKVGGTTYIGKAVVPYSEGKTANQLRRDMLFKAREKYPDTKIGFGQFSGTIPILNNNVNKTDVGISEDEIPTKSNNLFNTMMGWVGNLPRLNLLNRYPKLKEYDDKFKSSNFKEGTILYQSSSGTYSRILPYGMTQFDDPQTFIVKDGKIVPTGDKQKTLYGYGGDITLKSVKLVDKYFKPTIEDPLDVWATTPRFSEQQIKDLGGGLALWGFFSPLMKTGGSYADEFEKVAGKGKTKQLLVKKDRFSAIGDELNTLTPDKAITLIRISSKQKNYNLIRNILRSGDKNKIRALKKVYDEAVGKNKANLWFKDLFEQEFGVQFVKSVSTTPTLTTSQVTYLINRVPTMKYSGVIGGITSQFDKPPKFKSKPKLKNNVDNVFGNLMIGSSQTQPPVTTTLPKSITKQKGGTSTKNVINLLTGQISIPRYKIPQKQLPKYKFSTPIRPPIPQKPIGIKPPPFFWLPRKRKYYSTKTQRRRYKPRKAPKRRYQASVGAWSLGFYQEKEPKQKKFSGIEIRPIIGKSPKNYLKKVNKAFSLNNNFYKKGKKSKKQKLYLY